MERTNLGVTEMLMPADMKAHQIFVCANALETMIDQSKISGKLKERLLDLVAVISRDAEELTDDLDPCNPKGALSSLHPDLVRMASYVGVSLQFVDELPQGDEHAIVADAKNIIPFRRR